MEEAIAFVILGITALAIIQRNAPYASMFFVLAALAWLFAAYYFGNLIYPAGNTYLAYAATGLCMGVSVVMAVQVYLVIKPYKERMSYKDKKARNLTKIRNLTMPVKRGGPFEW